MTNKHLDRGTEERLAEFRRLGDRRDLKDMLTQNYQHAIPNSDSSVEEWALSALINARATIEELEKQLQRAQAYPLSGE